MITAIELFRQRMRLARRLFATDESHLAARFEHRLTAVNCLSAAGDRDTANALAGEWVDELNEFCAAVLGRRWPYQ